MLPECLTCMVSIFVDMFVISSCWHVCYQLVLTCMLSNFLTCILSICFDMYVVSVFWHVCSPTVVHTYQALGLTGNSHLRDHVHTYQALGLTGNSSLLIVKSINVLYKSLVFVLNATLFSIQRQQTPRMGGRRNLQRMWMICFVNNMKQIGLVDAPIQEEEHKTWQSAWCMAKVHR